MKINFASFEEMKDTFPETVYKYRRWKNKYDKRVITHGELYLASPRTFEDKKDCKQTVRFEKLRREQKLSFLKNIVKKEKEEKDKSWSEKTIEEITLKRYLSSKIRNEQTAKEFTDEMLNKIVFTSPCANHMDWGIISMRFCASYRFTINGNYLSFAQG